MEGWLEFVIGRYNYWIVIVLMMTGLYTVFARGNLVKKVVGLNLFQTSVFIFYITIGKIFGGTAPIYIGGELDHGGGHSDAPGATADHGDGAPAVEADHAPEEGGNAADGLHDKIDNVAPANDLKEALAALKADAGAGDGASLHETPSGAPSLANDKISNDALVGVAKPDAPTITLETADHSDPAAIAIGDAAHHAEAIIYTNPLPHVLILTAIVVGVATTAVGLALAVRIREAYGTIEEDELEAIDNVAEFGGDSEVTAGSAA